MSLQAITFCFLLAVSSAFVAPLGYYNEQARVGYANPGLDNYLQRSGFYQPVSEGNALNNGFGQITSNSRTSYSEQLGNIAPNVHDSVHQVTSIAPSLSLAVHGIIPPNPAGTMGKMKCLSVSTWLFSKTKVVIKCPADATGGCSAVYGGIAAIFFNINNGKRVNLKAGETFVTYVSYTAGFGICNPHPSQAISGYGE